ncbi:PREDICTED: beta-parvin [Elephantulus edwardii]|uniref:beta-parvin n=1 Tax=Elephantulus edwardii TaxID=28737 RepID=UPI0003F0E393|nr:PREDICTED: beta-parvin [Elephantulus edwardii]
MVSPPRSVCPFAGWWCFGSLGPETGLKQMQGQACPRAVAVVGTDPASPPSGASEPSGLPSFRGLASLTTTGRGLSSCCESWWLPALRVCERQWCPSVECPVATCVFTRSASSPRTGFSPAEGIWAAPDVTGQYPGDQQMRTSLDVTGQYPGDQQMRAQSLQGDIMLWKGDGQQKRTTSNRWADAAAAAAGPTEHHAGVARSGQGVALSHMESRSVRSDLMALDLSNRAHDLCHLISPTPTGCQERRAEVSDLQEEGKNAINSPLSPASVDIHPEDTLLEENEERTMISPTSKEDPKFKELVKVLIDWVNDVLVEERIIVKQLEEDLYDGQVLQKLLEKLADCKLNVAEVTQSEIGQKQKLQTVLEAVHDLLRPHGWVLRWTVDAIHGKNLVAILHLLVSLAVHFRAPIRLPEHVSVQVVVVRKREGLLHSNHITEELTTTSEMMMGRFERDAFDTLFDHAPDKLSVVKKSLITFVNKHLNKLNLEVTELESQFADGVYLVLLMGLLEDYFVPLHNFYLTPDSFDQKVHNVAFAFELMLDGGLKKPKARPEDVVNLDLKSTLRVLYNLFTKYKNVE